MSKDEQTRLRNKDLDPDDIELLARLDQKTDSIENKIGNIDDHLGELNGSVANQKEVINRNNLDGESDVVSRVDQIESWMESIKNNLNRGIWVVVIATSFNALWQPAIKLVEKIFN